MSAASMEAYRFEPVPLEQMPLEVPHVNALAAVTRAADTLRQRGDSFFPTDESGYTRRSVLLHTPEGPVHYFREANTYHDVGVAAVEYPRSLGQVPEHILRDTLGVERATLHQAVWDGSHTNMVSRGDWRFVATSVPGSHNWAQESATTRAEQASNQFQSEVVLDGRLGTLHIPELRSIGLADIRAWELDADFVEERPQVSDVRTVRRLDARFERFAQAVAKHFGGAQQLSSVTYETKPGLLSYHAPDTLHGRSAKWIIGSLAKRGYSVKEFLRRNPEKDKPGLKVLTGTKETWRGEETVAVYEGFSAFHYTSGAHEWRIVRGIRLDHPARTRDIDFVQKPLKPGGAR